MTKSIKTILPATEARTKFFKILDDIDEPNKTYTITLSGKPKAVIIPFDEYESWVETLEILRDTSLMKEIKKAKKEFERGEYVTLNQVLEEEGFIRLRKKPHHQVKRRGGGDCG